MKILGITVAVAYKAADATGVGLVDTKALAGNRGVVLEVASINDEHPFEAYGRFIIGVLKLDHQATFYEVPINGELTRKYDTGTSFATFLSDQATISFSERRLADAQIYTDLHEQIIADVLNAPDPYDEVGAIIDYENGELDHAGVIRLFQYLVNTGHINQLQGSYQRTALHLTSTGEITSPDA